MNRIRFAFLVAAALTGPIAAQTGNPYNGKWTVSFDGSRTADLTGTVVIQDDGGTWDVLAKASKNPCVGRAYPISVQKAGADELVFTVNRARTLAGCKDSTYTFKKLAEGNLKGELGDGRAAMLTRN
jgi:hypothetical protein